MNARPPERSEDHPADGALVLLTAAFVGGLVIASVLASKLIHVFGLVVPAGVLAYSITFPITDTIAEIWGRRRARLVVQAGFLALVISFGLIRLALWWPAAAFWEGEEAFAAILGQSSRIIIASVVAYLVSQLNDVWLFHLLRRTTGGRYLWLRNNLSTAVSQSLDTVLFITIAFSGIAPLGPLILGQLVVKLAIAVLDTPVVYGLVIWLRRQPRP